MTADENCAVGVAACCSHRTRCCSARNWSHPWPPSRRRSAPVSLAMHFVVSYLWLSPSRNWNGRTEKKGEQIRHRRLRQIRLLVNVRISLQLNRNLLKKTYWILSSDVPVIWTSRSLAPGFTTKQRYSISDKFLFRYTFGNREIAWHSSLRSFTQV